MAGSLHTKTSYWIGRGVYDDLSSFGALEARLNQIPEEKDRGDAFEIFIEGYLATQTITQCVKHWVVGDIPLSLRERYKLPRDSTGIDGIYEVHDGSQVAYQVKYRQNHRLTFSEVAEFLGITEQFSDRVIFTNAAKLSDKAIIRTRWVNAEAFRALSPEAFKSIEAWLKTKPSPIVKATPDPGYQVQALADIKSALAKGDRATAVMACGTGKTLVALWAAEQEAPKTVLVLVPSLTLLQQTLLEWSQQTSWGNSFSYLCVCSDPTVKLKDDGLNTDTSEVGFRVDTDPAIVRRFLKRQTSDIKVIFSTYQSSPVVGAGARGLPPFDLAVFDEAHKTIGRGDSALRFAISDENIRIKKRLFLTATPRHIDIRHRDKEGEFRVYSMDDEAVYGPRAYTLSFGKAAEKGIICRYKVIISLIDKEMVDDFTRKQGITLVERDEVGARWMANLIAVRQAIERVEAKKIISFHSRVRLAQEFASKEPRGIAYHLTDYDVRHVNGEQSSGDRGDIIREFAGSPKALLSNARCLTEGINIPAVDMVAFVDPRQSRIDITQAVGRAMRRPRGLTTKTVGYVVVPIFAGIGETDGIEGAIKSERFEAVVDVLNSLQEHDDELVDIIREIRQQKGKGEPFSPKRIIEKVEVIGPHVDLTLLTASISVEIAARIGSSWDEMFGKLLSFREQHDDCNVPPSYGDGTLCTWVEKNRSRQKAGMLSVDRERALNEIGFDWNPIPTRWHARYVQLKGWCEANGHCCPARNSESKELATWVYEQRLRYKLRRMSVDEKTKLDEIGFVFNVREAAWLESYESLKAFFKQHGHCSVPLSFSTGLVSWIRIQRQKYAKGTLDKKQIAALNALKISWNPYQDSWDGMFAKLKRYSERKRRSLTNVRIIEMDGELSSWLARQRSNYRKDRLDDVSVRKLESIGISWSPDAEFWDAMYEKLVRIKAKKGNCHVPYDHADKVLFNWVTNQRAAKKKGGLARDRKKRLEAIGFVWDTVLGVWDKGFAALEAYKAREGDCLVPQRHIEGTMRLGPWVNLQRSNEDTMPADRKRQLEAIGFVWEPRKAWWEKGFSAMRAFKAREGHCNVPQRHLEGDFKLGVWVNGQRTNKMKITTEDKKRLNEIGFIWRVRRARQSPSASLTP